MLTGTEFVERLARRSTRAMYLGLARDDAANQEARDAGGWTPELQRLADLEAPAGVRSWARSALAEGGRGERAVRSLLRIAFSAWQFGPGPDADPQGYALADAWVYRGTQTHLPGFGVAGASEEVAAAVQGMADVLRGVASGEKPPEELERALQEMMSKDLYARGDHAGGQVHAAEAAPHAGEPPMDGPQLVDAVAQLATRAVYAGAAGDAEFLEVVRQRGKLTPEVRELAALPLDEEPRAWVRARFQVPGRVHRAVEASLRPWLLGCEVAGAPESGLRPLIEAAVLAPGAG